MINLAPPPFKRRHFFTLFGRAALLGGFVDTARERPGRLRSGRSGSAGSRRLSVSAELEVQGCPNDIGLEIAAREKLDAGRHRLADLALDTQSEDEA
jgi:hypothetical protein